MAGYAEIVGRADLTDALVPEQVINEIIAEPAADGVIRNRAKSIRLSSKKAKQPVLASLPEAYWVDGDTGLKQTSKETWKNTTITAEELAVIVPIPDALIDDANIPLWAQIKPLLIEALDKKIDGAALFGLDKPDSWPEGIVPAAIAAGNTVTRGTGKDLGVDVAKLGQLVSKDGFGINGFASEPGLQWEMVGLRNEQGTPIDTPSLSAGTPSGLYGYPLNEVRTGVWNSEQAVMLAADWSKFVVGIRQDVTFDLFREGVISDASGKVILNLMQQDSKALRVVFRTGFQVANPLTRLNSNEATRYPAGVILPGSGAGEG